MKRSEIETHLEELKKEYYSNEIEDAYAEMRAISKSALEGTNE